MEVARVKSFSQAALNLNVTQSALSQRVLNLEQELGSSLFIRDRAGVRLTDLGQKLLRYGHSKHLLEEEFMAGLKASEQGGLSGIISVAGFSTVSRSMLLPVFCELVKKHPEVHLDLQVLELRDIPHALFSGAADLAVTNEPIRKQDVESHLLGYEEYVLIQSTSKNARPDVYLDYDEADTITADFFKLQKQKAKKIQRNFVGDIYSIFDGVKMGLGRAVVPLHIAEEMKGLEVVGGYSAMKIPVYLGYYTQAFYTRLQERAIETLKSGATDYLSL